MSNVYVRRDGCGGELVSHLNNFLNIGVTLKLLGV